MARPLEEIAHSAALELAHRCGVAKADIDMAEVIVLEALRNGIKVALRSTAAIKTGKKNPNRDYVSE